MAELNFYGTQFCKAYKIVQLFSDLYLIFFIKKDF